jgi:hypothetical protein
MPPETLTDFTFDFHAENTALSGSIIAVADGVVRVDGLSVNGTDYKKLLESGEDGNRTRSFRL